MKHTLRQRLYAGAACCFAPLCAWAAEPGATTVYRSVDANGVVSFSDAPRGSAVPIEVVPPRVPLQEDVERANARFEQQLALLELLETSRQARAREELEQQRLDLDFVRTEAALQRAREAQAPQSSVAFFPAFWGSPWQRPSGPRPPSIERPPPPVTRPPQQVWFPH